MRTTQLFTLLILATAASLSAQERSFGTRIASLTAPLGDADAVVIAYVDPGKIDLAAAADWAAKTMKASDHDRDQIEASLKEPRQMQTLFRNAGGKEIIWLVFPSTPENPGIDPVEMAAIATCDQGKADQVAALLKMILPADRFEVTTHNDRVIAASAHRTKKLNAAAKPSAQIAKAFDGAGGGAVQVLLQISDDMRRVVRETLPPLPDHFDGATGKDLAEWFAWASISADAPPKPRLRLTVQATSPEAARSLEKVVSRWYELGGPIKEIREHVPDFDRIVPLLTPKASGDRVVLAIGEKPDDLEKLLPVIVLPIQAARNAATRAQHTNSLKQLGIALHNYHDTHARFPAAASYSKDGKTPLLSWRVHVLPFLGEAPLYKEFRLDEPWDSEHNKKLIEKIPKVYADPRVPMADKGKTTFVAPAGEGTVFGGKEGMKIQRIIDGTSNTILLVESDAANAVIWTKPGDLKVDPEMPIKGIFVDADKQISVLFADGSVRILPAEDAAKLPAYYTAGGGEVVQP